MKKIKHNTIVNTRKEIQKISRVYGIEELNITVYTIDEDNILSSDLQVEITTIDGEYHHIIIESFEEEIKEDIEANKYYEYVEEGLKRHKTNLNKLKIELEKYNIEINDIYNYTC